MPSCAVDGALYRIGDKFRELSIFLFLQDHGLCGIREPSKTSEEGVIRREREAPSKTRDGSSEGVVDETKKNGCLQKMTMRE
jgi:hypothetical protein